MLASRVMRGLPLRGHDRPLSDLHDAVTGREADLGCSFNQFDVRPLEAVPMHVVGNLAEQDAFGFEDTISFSNKFRVQMGEVISIRCRRLDDEAESAVEILRLVLALIGYVGRIVDNDVKRAVLERHVAVIADHVRVKLGVNVQTHDLSFAASSSASVPNQTEGRGEYRRLSAIGNKRDSFCIFAVLELP